MKKYEIGKSYHINGYPGCIYRGVVVDSGKQRHKFAWGVYAVYINIKEMEEKFAGGENNNYFCSQTNNKNNNLNPKPNGEK